VRCKVREKLAMKTKGAPDGDLPKKPWRAARMRRNAFPSSQHTLTQAVQFDSTREGKNLGRTTRLDDIS
jgi:hypothetical protein